MKVNDVARVEVEWFPTFVNDPEIRLILKRDRELTMSTVFRWRGCAQPGWSHMFYTEHEGEVQFLLHNPRDHEGFGWRQYHLHMADDWDPNVAKWVGCNKLEFDCGAGFNRKVECTFNPHTRMLTLTGPWSSGASAVSRLLRPVISAATLTGPNRLTVSNPDYYHRMKRQGRAHQGTPYSTYYTLAFMQEVIDTHAPWLELYNGDYGHYPVRKGDAPKNPRKGRPRVSCLDLSDDQCRAIEF